MPKDLIKKYMPDPEKIKRNKSLVFLGDVLHEPNLWHLNRHSVTKAVALGLFWGCLPIPFQMVASALCALRFNANLPISVGIVWFSNPLTMPPIFYFEYLVGAWLLDMPYAAFEYEMTLAWFQEKLYEIGLPLLVGSLFCGAILSACGYFLFAQIWRRSAINKWHKRQEDRARRATIDSENKA